MTVDAKGRVTSLSTAPVIAAGAEPSIAKAPGYAKWNGSAWQFVNEAYSLTTHTHPTPTAAQVGAEPAITKATGYAKWNGSAWVFVDQAYALSGHTHPSGPGSGLDADTVDGAHAGSLVRGLNQSCSRIGPVNWAQSDDSQWKSGFWDVSGANWTPNNSWWWGITTAHTANSSGYCYGAQLIFESAANPNIYARTLFQGSGGNPWRKIWHDGCQGAGSGMNADLLDGKHGYEYINRSEVVGSVGYDWVPHMAAGVV